MPSASAGTIPNPDGRLKADMLVRTLLEIPPTARPHRHPPTLPMIVADGYDAVFVRVPGHDDQFRRRPYTLSRSRPTTSSSPRAFSLDEVVVTSGSLVTSQILENLHTVDTGTP